eukprot:c21793_g1_i2 orf=679-915(+)
MSKAITLCVTKCSSMQSLRYNKLKEHISSNMHSYRLDTSYRHQRAKKEPSYSELERENSDAQENASKQTECKPCQYLP